MLLRPDANPAPMRILLVTTGLKTGGAEHQVVSLARSFLGMGHDVALLSLSPGRDIEPPPGAHVVELNMRKTPADMTRALWQARALVRAWRPDVMHAHMVHANLFARALTRLTSCPPLVSTGHSFREGGRLRMLAYRLTDSWTALTTHVSNDGRAGMIAAGAVPASRIVVVPNGIDVARFRPDPTLGQSTRAQLGVAADEPLLLNVGRLVPEKAQDVLIRAFGQIDSAVPARLLIAGDGPLRAPLTEMAASLGLISRITLLGPRDDIPALLNAADAFALSSNIEGMPLVLAEALACGCPVVSTDAPGAAEVLGTYGAIVPRGDLAGLAQAMTDVLRTGRGTPAQVAARRERVVAAFSIDAVAQRWLTLYAGLAMQAASPRTETA